MPDVYAAASASSWSTVHSYLLVENLATLQYKHVHRFSDHFHVNVG